MHLHWGAVLASSTSPATFGKGHASFLAWGTQLVTQTRLRKWPGALQGTVRFSQQPLPPASWQQQQRALTCTLPTSQLRHSHGFPKMIRMQSWVPWEASSTAWAPETVLRPCYYHSWGLTPKHRLSRSKKTHLSCTSLMGTGFALAACLAFPKTQPAKAKLSPLNAREFGRAACTKVSVGAPSTGGWPCATTPRPCQKPWNRGPEQCATWSRGSPAQSKKGPQTPGLYWKIALWTHWGSALLYLLCFPCKLEGWSDNKRVFSQSEHQQEL